MKNKYLFLVFILAAFIGFSASTCGEDGTYEIGELDFSHTVNPTGPSEPQAMSGKLQFNILKMKVLKLAGILATPLMPTRIGEKLLMLRLKQHGIIRLQRRNYCMG